MITVKVIADSVNLAGDRLTSFELTYPRFIHCELLTHRVFSRNSASSRAIPLHKALARIRQEPAMPVYWGAEQKGMQSGAELDEFTKNIAIKEWLAACESACNFAQNLGNLGVHKSIANRITEPWAHMVTLLSGTDWVNFFNLRAHKEAQPEFQALAYMMLDAWQKNTPELKKPGEWHLPYADQYVEGLNLEQLKKISTARAARTSVKNQDGDIKYEDDYKLHDRLLTNGHWCYDDKTEVLTSKGFKNWTEVVLSDLLAAVDPKTFEVNFEKPSHLVCEPYEEKMYKVVGQQLDLCVTPQHRMLVSKRTHDGWQPHEVKTAEECFEGSNRYVVAGNLSQKGRTCNWLVAPELVGFFVGDGNISGSEVQFNIRLERKIAYLRSICQVGLEMRQSGTCIIRNGELAKWLKENCYTESGEKKLPDEALFSDGPDVFRLLEGLRNSDGSIKRNTWVYDTTSTLLRDQIQALCAINNIAAQVDKPRHSGEPHHKECWRINFSGRLFPEVSACQQGRSNSYSEEWVQYKGNVYCATVSTGFLIVRRNRKVVISGNSPFEHAAEAMASSNRLGNFIGWKQYRKSFGNENMVELNVVP